MRQDVFEFERIMNSAAAGCTRARDILAALAEHQAVTVDFAKVEYLTPSFANAFIMTLMAALPDERALVDRVRFENCISDHRATLAHSLARFRHGVRLTTQVPAAAPLLGRSQHPATGRGHLAGPPG